VSRHPKSCGLAADKDNKLRIATHNVACVDELFVHRLIFLCKLVQLVFLNLIFVGILGKYLYLIKESLPFFSSVPSHNFNGDAKEESTNLNYG